MLGTTSYSDNQIQMPGRGGGVIFKLYPVGFTKVPMGSQEVMAVLKSLSPLPDLNALFLSVLCVTLLSGHLIY